jgi:DNA-binding beta-propeller fold protein YncE
MGITTTPDGKKLIASSDSGGVQGLSVIDAAKPGMIGTPAQAANLFMGVAATRDGRVYASAGNADRVYRFRLVGGALVNQDPREAGTFPTQALTDGIIGHVQNPPPNGPADGIRVSGYPGNMVLGDNLLYVAGNLAEPSGTGAEHCQPAPAPPAPQPPCSRITIIDTKTDTVIGRAAVGAEAYGLALDTARHRLYVSNWADQGIGRGQTGGTVSVVDVSNPRAPQEVAEVIVGHHPSAIQLSLDRTRLFVANTNDDTISVLNVVCDCAPTVIATESVKPSPLVPVGAHPDAFALSPDGKTLFVALAGINAVELRDGATAARLSAQPTYIPTGWYPAALAVTPYAGGYRLWVTNAKGNGFGIGYNGTVFFEGSTTGGTVQAVNLPQSSSQEGAWTQQVSSNDHLDQVAVDPCDKSLNPSEVLCPPPGFTSPIRHVVYIVTENKTFDQYFGDLSTKQGYDADPKFILYGNTVTPNHHKLTQGYSLGDRFFSDAEVSVTGHSWTSGAIATDHNEKTWPADYDSAGAAFRGSHGNGDPAKPQPPGGIGGQIGALDSQLNDPQGGYIFEAFRAAGALPPGQGGLTMGIYGEHTAMASGDMSAYKAKGTQPDGSVVAWKDGDIQYFDTCRAQEFINGKAVDGVIPGGYNNKNARDYFADCQGRVLDPQFTLKQWTADWKAGKGDTMPNFIYMSLPDNHTVGTNLGSPTPASMVADNDYAFGLIIAALSKSPFWGSTVVMQTEDDTQIAGDHISPLRDYLQVVSPWAKRGVNHQYGSMPSLLRTIEQLFRVYPISLYDQLAVPQHGAFLAKLTDKPNLDPYQAVTPRIPFAVNQPGAAGQALSMSLDWSTYDRVDMGILNAILYADAWHTPLQLPTQN